MQHSFNVKIAEKLGMLEAVIVANLHFWIQKNKANKVNYFDGRYWTYNSTSAFAELFPYATKSQVRRALEKLRNEGIIMTGNYNQDAHSRTLWYAFTDAGLLMLSNADAFFESDADADEVDEESSCDCDQEEDHVSPAANAFVTNDKCMCHQQQMHLSPVTNAFVTSDKCIKTDNKQQIVNTDSKPDNKRIGASSPKTLARFTPPTIEEVREYCIERKNAVNPEAFLSHYQSNGWLVGKAKMKDWKAAVRTWEHNGVGGNGGRRAMTMPDYMKNQGQQGQAEGSGKVDPEKLRELRQQLARGELC